MDEFDDRIIQEHVEANRPLLPSKDALLYQQLFIELGKEPSVQPSASFSLNVINHIKQQQAASAIERFDELMISGILLVFLASFFGLLYWYEPTTLSIAWHTFWLAKEWLLSGFACILLFLALEHRLLQKDLVNRFYLE